MGIFSQLRNRVKSQDFGMPEVLEPRRRRRGLAGLFGRMPEKLVNRMQDKVPFGPVSQPEMMAPQMMQPQLFGRPLEGISFSDINIKNIPTLPDFSQGLPPEILERIQGNMQRMGRLPFAEGEEADIEDYEASTQSLIDFLNSDPEQVSFGRAVAGMLAYDDGVIQITEKELDDYSKNYLARNREMASALGLTVDDIRAESLEAIRRMKEGPLMEGGKYNPLENPRRVPEFAEGGEVFPDLTGDGKVTQADILKGRGVFAEGDEVSMMMMELEGDEGMPAGDMEGLEELGEISGPETEMLNNIINQIIELIAQGATEEEIIQFLMEQGLDQEDITAVMSMLSEQLTANEGGIDQELAALG